MLELPSTAKMPTEQDQYDVCIDLVTMAGTEYTMQTNITRYEDMMQLEDDILCFLPTVSDIDVFGCEVDLIDFATQLPLPAAFHTALMQQRKLQIVVRPCMVESHSIWQFQEGDEESYSKAVRVPVNPRRETADRAFYAAPMLRHVEIGEGIQHVGFSAWQECQQLQIVKLPSSVSSLEDGAFHGCYALREVVAPGCVQFSRRVFAECCSLSRVGVSQAADDSNVLAPGAQLGRCAFESCLTPHIHHLCNGPNRESLTHKLLTENQKLSCSKHLVSQVSQRPESKTKEKTGKRHAHFSPHT